VKGLTRRRVEVPGPNVRLAATLDTERAASRTLVGRAAQARAEAELDHVKYEFVPRGGSIILLLAHVAMPCERRKRTVARFPGMPPSTSSPRGLTGSRLGRATGAKPASRACLSSVRGVRHNTCWPTSGQPRGIVGGRNRT